MSKPKAILMDESSIGVSSFGASVNVLDCGAVTADNGVETEESLADRGVCSCGLEITGFPDVFFKEEVDCLENNICNEGFLSRLARRDVLICEANSGPLEESRPSSLNGRNIVGEKLGSERTGIERRFSLSGDGDNERGTFPLHDGNGTGPSRGMGLLITGKRRSVGDGFNGDSVGALWLIAFVNGWSSAGEEARFEYEDWADEIKEGTSDSLT